MQEQKFIFKILSGLHVGAEHYLPLGDTVLGKSPTCDLIIQDQGISDQHLLLTNDGSAIRIQCLDDQKIFLNDVEQSAPFNIDEFGVVTIATTYLAIGNENATWNIPTLQEIHSQINTQLSSSDAETEPMATDDELPATTNDKLVSEVDAQSEDKHADELNSNEDISPSVAPSAKISSKLFWFIPIILVSLLIVLFYWHFLRSTTVDINTSTLGLSDIRMIAESNNINASFHKNSEGLLISGYALTAKDERNLIQELKEHGVLVRTQLTVMEDLKNSLQQSFDRYLSNVPYEHIAVKLNKRKIGALIFQGYIQDPDKWQSIRTTIIQGIQSLNYVDNVKHWDDGFNYLKKLIDNHQLLKYIYIEEDKRNDSLNLFYRNEHSLKKETDIRKLVEKYAISYNHPTVVFYDKSYASTREAPTFTKSQLIGASLNDHPYLVFDDNKHYAENSITPDGYKIEYIGKDFVSMSKNGKWYSYKFSDNKETKKK